MANVVEWAECAKSAQCAPVKHHFEECVERVTKAEEEPEKHKGPKEDCVEECMSLSLAAQRLFAFLKSLGR